MIESQRWTEESIVAAFKRDVAFWQPRLRLQDVDFDVTVENQVNSDANSDAWCSVKRRNGGDNHHACWIRIKRGEFATVDRREVWSTVCHEMIHALILQLSEAFEPLTDHFSTSQLKMAGAVMRVANEALTYKFEAIFTKFYEADAPKAEVVAAQPTM